jgi:hypothetical protein
MFGDVMRISFYGAPVRPTLRRVLQERADVAVTCDVVAVVEPQAIRHCVDVRDQDGRSVGDSACRKAVRTASAVDTEVGDRRDNIGDVCGDSGSQNCDTEDNESANHPSKGQNCVVNIYSWTTYTIFGLKGVLVRKREIWC